MLVVGVSIKADTAATSICGKISLDEIDIGVEIINVKRTNYIEVSIRCPEFELSIGVWFGKILQGINNKLRLVPLGFIARTSKVIWLKHQEVVIINGDGEIWKS